MKFIKLIDVTGECVRYVNADRINQIHAGKDSAGRKGTMVDFDMMTITCKESPDQVLSKAHEAESVELLKMMRYTAIATREVAAANGSLMNALVPAAVRNDDKEVVLPRPVDGPIYDGWSLERWLLKVCEEAGEAVTAGKEYRKALDVFENSLKRAYPNFTKEAKDNYINMCQNEKAYKRYLLLRELTDVGTIAESVKKFLGADLEERQKLQKEVNDSNASRDDGRRFAKKE